MKRNDLIKAVESKKKNNNKNNQTPKKTKKKNNKTNIKKKAPVIKKAEPTPRDEYIKIPKKLTRKQKAKKYSIIFGIILVLIIIAFLAFYKATEYQPKETEKLEITGESFNDLKSGDTFQIMTWNIGYGALGETADYYKENGKMVITADRHRINKNLANIRMRLDEEKSQIIMLQEVDVSSKRDSHVDEASSIRNHLLNYSAAFATNIKVTYVPYPMPTIGRLHSGIQTLSKYNISKATRVSLPESFRWPSRMFNYKRCLLITRLQITESDKELVLINLDLEAYDKGKGKEEQTKKLIEVMNKEKEKGNYVIVGGDFNQVFSSIDSSKYKLQDNLWKPGEINTKDFGKGWQFIMDNKTPTKRSLDQPYIDADKDKFQYYLVDGFIVSDNIKVDSVTTKDYEFVASDHNPVVMKVTLTK